MVPIKNLNSLAPSELILNKDGSIYHLNLLPEDIAQTIITVGDPDRVSAVTKHFDTIEISKQKREFKTETGLYKGKRITVISTGIGTDNIDIVFNELDALANIDFNTRTIKDTLTQLTIVRIGTSGAIQESIPLDCFLASEMGIGFDNLLHFYNADSLINSDLSEALIKHTNWNTNNSKPYVISCDETLANLFNDENFRKGITATNVGFYGPQGRKLRLDLKDNMLNSKLETFNFNGKMITNLEMETSGIYGLSKLLGHRAISLNAIIANRATGVFSEKPKETVALLIESTLNKLATL